jgi:hypothetical protein
VVYILFMILSASSHQHLSFCFHQFLLESGSLNAPLFEFHSVL